MFEVFDLASHATRWLSAPIPPTDPHELHLMSNGDLMMLSNPLVKAVDLTPLGFSSNATILDCVAQEVDSNGNIVWQWRASDHISAAESTHPFLTQVAGQPAYDIYHCNSVDTDPVSGDVLVSSRHTDAIYLIDRTTGLIIWKLGGNSTNHDNAQILTITGDPDGAFHAQHDARFQPDSKVSLYDNETWDHTLAARGAEYRIDTAAGTATLVWSYSAPDGLNSGATGSFRPLNGGNDNVIGWGVKGNNLFTEIDAAGSVILDVSFSNGEHAYRVQKVEPAALNHDLLRATAGLPRYSTGPDSDPAPTATGTILGAVEGASFAGAVGSFSDPDPNAQATEFLATIAWGDGSSSAGTINGQMGGPFTVTGTHTYAEEGTNVVTVYISDPSDPLSNTVTATSTANVSDAALTATGTTISATEGASFSGTIGSLSDADPNATAADYSATVAWGDGSTSQGTVGGPDGGPFTVSGSHTYAEEGTDTVTISITDTDSPANGVTAISTVTVADAPFTASGTTMSAIEGTTFSGTVGSISDTDPGALATDYSASIDWGDGSTSSGMIGGPTGGPFTVSGSHTYAEEGSNSVTLSVAGTESSADTVTASSTASGSDAGLSASCAVPANAPNPFKGAIVGLADADPNGTTADYTATVAWGDGSSSAGTVSGPAGGPFTVSGTHSYAATGTFNVSTTINDAGGTSTSTSCSMLVFGFAPGGGSFAVGNNNSATGSQVTFWSSQWWKQNSLSAGSAPANFKGFAPTPATPACGVGWSTNAVTSAPPPGPLPAFMGVIVTSSASQNGGIDFGNTLHIVVVQTNPGYQPSTGAPGTGAVVAQVC